MSGAHDSRRTMVSIPLPAETSAPVSAPVRVLLVDDDPLVLIALRSVLRTDPSLTVVAEVEDGALVILAVRRTRPDVVLLDARMRTVSGPEVIGPLRRAAPEVRIIVMSSFIGAESESAVLVAGADAFLPKVSPPGSSRPRSGGSPASRPRGATSVCRRASATSPALSPRGGRTRPSHARSG
ncbi:response regulator transcription factor [Rathayibacter oskolensis]|uniref:response regulator n=1 Tax=Rathayibacter oskolensis TaxID=1891671 RepID=UPI0026605B72|nr:response regulator transcription factor [Rathayibacter oskolensis]WKK72160.1 response regulator transcription factor [Rathayibacter oskolensis]